MSYLIDGLKSFDFCVTPCQNNGSIEVTRRRKKFSFKALYFTTYYAITEGL